MESKMYTMCIVQKGEDILLLNRPAHRGFPGYLGPGGKVEIGESITEAAIREVYEETGLIIKELHYKGVDGYSDVENDFRYHVYNFVATAFEGELLTNPPEGQLRWVKLTEIDDLPMQPWFKRRLPLFFEEGIFEIHEEWIASTEKMVNTRIHKI